MIHFLFFSLQIYPVLEDDSKACLPQGSFTTCSSDGTIRIWNVENNSNNNENTFRKNIYSNVSSSITYVFLFLNSINVFLELRKF